MVKASDCFIKALHIKKKYYTFNHLSIGETMFELAKTQKQAELLDDAILNFEGALLIYEKKLGPHSITSSILDALDSTYLDISKLDVSYRYLERALLLKRILCGNDSETVSDTLYLIGKVQGKSGDIKDALDTFKEGKGC
jgi:tetratricopeptide (TPR) repeat protein